MDKGLHEKIKNVINALVINRLIKYPNSDILRIDFKTAILT